MKSNFYKSGLALFVLVTLLSLLAACGDSTAPSVGSVSGGQPAPGSNNLAPTATGGPTVAVVPVVTATVAIGTTVPATTSAPVSTTSALPTVTPQPTTQPAATPTSEPTATTVPELTATPEPTATFKAPSVTPQPDETTAPSNPVPGDAPEATVPATSNLVVSTVPPVKGTLPAFMTTPTVGPKGPARLTGQIVFEASGKIYLVNPDGTGLKQITKGHSPAFSPDGQRIAFVSDNETSINSIDLNGNSLQGNCATEGHIARIVRWSPSGKYVAVDSQNNDAQGSSEIQLCDMTHKGVGSLQTVLRDNNPAKIVFDWSLDEKYILWQSSSEVPNTDPDYLLWYSKPETGIAQWEPVTPDREYKSSLQEGLMFINARISPTNKTVMIVGDKVFFKSTPGYTSSYDGLVLKDFDAADGVAWAPDSTAVLISGVYKNNPGMYLYYFESKKVVQLTDYITSGYLDWTRK